MSSSTKKTPLPKSKSATSIEASAPAKNGVSAREKIGQNGSLNDADPTQSNMMADIPGILWETALHPDGTVSGFNYLSESAERILGFDREHLLRTESWSEMVHPEDLPSFWEQQKKLFASGDRGTIQHRVITPDGRTIWLDATITLVRDEAGKPVAMRGLTLDITERYRSGQRWKFLAKSSDLFGQSLDVETALKQTTQLLVPEIADMCTIFLVHGVVPGSSNDAAEQTDGPRPPLGLERFSLVGSTPEQEEMSRESSIRFPSKPETQEMYVNVLKSKQSILISEITDEFRRIHSQSPEHLEFMQRMDARSLIITPLYAHDELLGVIAISISGTRPRYTEEDKLFVEEIAHQASFAIHRARLFSDAQAEVARRKAIQERMEFLSHASAVLASTVKAEEALKELAISIVPKIADLCVVVLTDENGGTRPLVVASDPPSIAETLAEMDKKFPNHSHTSFGLQQVITTKWPRVYLNIDDALLESFSTGPEHLAMFQSLGLTSSLFYPLVAHGHIYGALLLATSEHSGRRFEEEDTSFGEDITLRAALAIYKSRLLQEAERELERRSRLQGRMELLEEVSKVVSSSLDVTTLVERVARVLSPNFADWMAIDLVSDLARPERVLLYHADPSLRPAASEYREQYGSITTKALTDIVRTGKPILVSQVDATSHQLFGVSGERSKLLAVLGDGSFLMVPMSSRRRSLGAIGFHLGHSGRHYAKDDIEFAVEVATHIAAGIDNAILFTETERQMAELQSIYHSSPIGLALMDAAGRYRRVNESLADIHNLPLGSHIGRTPDEALGAVGTRLTEFIEEVIRTGTPIRDIEVSNVNHDHPDEARTWLQSFFPIYGEETGVVAASDSKHPTGGVHLDHTPEGANHTARTVIGVSASSMDITERKRFEKRIEDAKEKAEVASRAKDQFIATLSHELRTPLTPVLATVELLSDDGEFPDTFRPFLDLIRRNIEIEARLIDDLLDMTRIAKGKLRMTEGDLDLHALIPEIIEMCRPDLERGNIRVLTKFSAINSFIRGDRDRMSQVLWNLLHNAIKFTPTSGMISIRTRNDDGGKLIVEVQDTGRGIASGDLKRIFDPFEQEAGARTGSQAGLGLGLAISRSIVEMHGGTIEAFSEGLGKGSTFVMRLRATELKPVTTVKGIPRSVGAKGGRILFVDDHLDTNAALKILLERRGYHVTTAASVASGLELARKEEFDLLVSDIGLPDGDGTDLLRMILKERPMKAIAVSGYSTDADVEKSRSAGFQHHLKKPIAFPDLERVIAEVLAG